ncbi:hypothetical protein ACWGQ4_16235 [Streptomyces sp. NPDC055721]|uniref:hypothetical protein n=1 Tax=Streptomyces sp. NPDC127132 TaxID=3345374 RepID=UPI00363B6602
MTSAGPSGSPVHSPRESAPAGLLLHGRHDGQAATVPVPGRPLLASSPIEGLEGPPGAVLALPAHTTVWWTA